MSPKVYTPPSSQDWCKACNDPHVQNSYHIYQHKMRLEANDRVSIDFFVDKATLKANLVKLLELANRVVETRSTIR